MGIRVQPRELDISAEDPFEHDLLDRKESVEVLSSIIGSIEGPCVLAVDAPWGTGKTTFLKMLAHSLRNQAFTVVDFNAWETDFAEDPFVALSSEITDGLKGTGRKVGKLKRAIPEVIRTMGPLLPVAVSAIPHAGPALARVVDEFQADRAETSTSRYTEGKKAFREFKQALESAATSLAKANEGKPLVVVIDELDRCRPSYAVALLEVAKHLFTVDRIVFVLAIDRTQLAHSIKVLYGHRFDAEGYLRRFFDVDYHLPNPDRKKFITSVLSTTGFTEYFEQATGYDLNDAEHAKILLQDILSKSHLSLRDASQAMHRLGLMLSSLQKDRQAFAIILVVLMIVRSIDPDLYHRFTAGEATDNDAVDGIFGIQGLDAMRNTSTGKLLEAVLIAARREIGSSDVDSPYRATSERESPLYYRYEQLKEMQAPNDGDKEERNHAQRVCSNIRQLHDRAAFRGHPSLGVEQTIQRIELLSSDLKEEEPPTSEP